jgi:hypothetical protein
MITNQETKNLLEKVKNIKEDSEGEIDRWKILQMELLTLLIVLSIHI